MEGMNVVGKESTAGNDADHELDRVFDDLLFEELILDPESGVVTRADFADYKRLSLSFSEARAVIEDYAAVVNRLATASREPFAEGAAEILEESNQNWEGDNRVEGTFYDRFGILEKRGRALGDACAALWSYGDALRKHRTRQAAAPRARRMSTRGRSRTPRKAVRS
jgi:hypothetical protein